MSATTLLGVWTLSMARSPQQRRPDIAESHHVARHCGHQTIDRDPVTGEIRGVFPQAFELRTAKKELYLSLNWFEYFAGTLTDQYKGVVAALRDKRTVKSNTAIARLNAGLIVQTGKVRGLALRVRDRSSASNPGYVGLEGMPKDNSDKRFLGLLASKCCVEVRGVKAIDS